MHATHGHQIAVCEQLSFRLSLDLTSLKRLTGKVLEFSYRCVGGSTTWNEENTKFRAARRKECCGPWRLRCFYSLPFFR